MIYTLRRAFLIALVGVGFLLGNNVFAIAVGEPADPVILTVQGCDIAIGSSVCTPTSALLENPGYGKRYSLFNATTQVSSPSAFIPNNDYEYNPQNGGTALELRYGSNTLQVRGVGGVVAQADPNGSCVSGAAWNGSVCAVSVAAKPSGSIILDSATCTIPIGSSQCGSKLSWSVTNPVEGKTELIVSGGFNYTMNQNSYVQTLFYNKTGENVSTYVLKNNSILLDTKTVTSKCETGSTWDGNKCKSSSVISNDFVLGSGSLSRNAGTGNYLYALAGRLPNQLSCYYRQTDILGELNNIGIISTDVATNQDILSRLTIWVADLGGNTTGPSPYGVLAVNYPNVGSYCKGLIPVTAVPSGSIIIDSATCTIPAGGVQCSAKVSWSVAHPVVGKTALVISGGYNYTMTQDTYPQTSFYNKTGENTTTFTLKNNGVVLDTKTLTSKCAAGSTWNGTRCSGPLTNTVPGALSGVIILDSSTCTIPVGGSYCGTKISYSVNNPVFGKTVFNVSTFGGYYLSKDVYSPTTFMNQAGENTATYTLKNNGVLLDTKTVTSKCAQGSIWNGSACYGDRVTSVIVPVDATSSEPVYKSGVDPVVIDYRGTTVVPKCTAGYAIVDGSCRIVTSTSVPTMPLPATPVFDATKFVLKIDQSSVLTRGFVQAVDGNTLSVRTIGGVWTVIITPSTGYVSKDSKRPLISVGDFIGVQGYILPSQDYSFTATVFRNRTLYP